MIIYRIEKEDGGGPFYYRDGRPRDSSMPDFSNGDINILYGADSLENLKHIINNYNLNINDFIIKTYESNNILSYNKKNGHIIFKINK
jgi:hypothetical protein